MKTAIIQVKNQRQAAKITAKLEVSSGSKINFSLIDTSNSFDIIKAHKDYNIILTGASKSSLFILIKGENDDIEKALSIKS